jgi:predicted nucleic acid-binding Zn ribbon protein
MEPTREEQQEAWNLSQIRQRPSNLNAKPIGSLVRTLMARRGYGQTQASEELERQWKLAAGQTLGAYSRPAAISKGVLNIVVDSSSALQELHFSKKQILKQLNAAMPQANIRDIRGKIG